MLDWLFRPSCPCDAAAKVWVEKSLDWLAEQFDDSAFSGRRIVLPTPAFFPDPFDHSPAAIHRLVERICGYMDVEIEQIDLRIVAEANKLQLINEKGQLIPNSAGTFQVEDGKFLVRIDSTAHGEALDFVGTIAHELAHARLMGEDRVDGEDYDNELLTDLTVVHFGLGIFLANTPRNYESQYSRWPDTNLIRPEYMSPPMFGWALAHLAWFRGEEKPEWARYLNSGARANLYQGIRYLNSTTDSQYRPIRHRSNRRIRGA